MEQPTKIEQPELLVDRRQSPVKVPAVRSRKTPAQVTVQPVAQPTTPMDLLRIVTERGASVEEIGKFMELMERQQRREAEQAYIRAFTAFKKNVQTIYKDEIAKFEAKGQRVAYDHATLGHICEQIIAQMAEFGLSHRWDPQQPDNGMVVTTCILSHEHAHSERATVQFPPDPSGTKNALQAVGSALTYGERYSLLAVCGIAVKSQGDDDANGAGGKDATLADYWAMKAGGAATQEALQQVWAEGVAKISEKGDKAAYATFKAAVNARKQELAA